MDSKVARMLVKHGGDVHQLTIVVNTETKFLIRDLDCSDEPKT